VVWQELKSTFDDMKLISLPAARHECINLLVQDYTTTTANNSELFRITAQLAVCGQPAPAEELIEKTLSTFHAANLILATKYWNIGFRQYFELTAYMLLVETTSDPTSGQQQNMTTKDCLPSTQEQDQQQCSQRTTKNLERI
jgi:hypothetical protein